MPPEIVSSKKAAGPIRFITGGVLFFLLKGGEVYYNSNNYHKFQNSSIMTLLLGRGVKISPIHSLKK